MIMVVIIQPFTAQSTPSSSSICMGHASVSTSGTLARNEQRQGMCLVAVVKELQQWKEP